MNPMTKAGNFSMSRVPSPLRWATVAARSPSGAVQHPGRGLVQSQPEANQLEQSDESPRLYHDGGFRRAWRLLQRGRYREAAHAFDALSQRPFQSCTGVPEHTS